MKTMIPTLMEASHTIRRLRQRNVILEAKVEVLDIIRSVMSCGTKGCYASPDSSIEDRLDKTIQEIELAPEVSPVSAPPTACDVTRPPPVKEPGTVLVKTRGPYKKREGVVTKGLPPLDVRKQSGAKSTAAQKAPPSQSVEAMLEGKADTVVGAMKSLLRDEAEPFTAELLRENLLEDADFKKLLERDGGEKSFQSALYNWVYTGKLEKDGDNYSITATGKEWFGK